MFVVASRPVAPWRRSSPCNPRETNYQSASEIGKYVAKSWLLFADPDTCVAISITRCDTSVSDACIASFLCPKCKAKKRAQHMHQRMSQRSFSPIGDARAPHARVAPPTCRLHAARAPLASLWPVCRCCSEIRATSAEFSRILTKFSPSSEALDRSCLGVART